MNLLNLITTVQAQTINPVTSQADLRTFLPAYLNYAFSLGGMVAVIYLVYGGINYITAGGDESKVETARNTITYAVLGIIIITISFAIVTWINNAANGAVPSSI